MRAYERAHVLDDAQHRDVHPAAHRQRLGDVGECDVLGRGDEDRAADRNGLRQRQLGVGGARRLVDHEVVEFAPVDVAQELLDRPSDERPAPHHGLALGHEELDRDHLDAIALEGLDLAGRRRLRLTLRTDHLGDVRPGDVSVEQTNGSARLGEGNREVDAHRALTHSALPRGDRDDVLDPGQDLLLWDVRSGTPHHRAPADLDRLRAERLEGARDVGFDLVLERTRRCRQLDRERDPGAVDDQVLDHVPGH